MSVHDKELAVASSVKPASSLRVRDPTEKQKRDARGAAPHRASRPRSSERVPSPVDRFFQDGVHREGCHGGLGRRLVLRARALPADALDDANRRRRAARSLPPIMKIVSESKKFSLLDGNVARTPRYKEYRTPYNLDTKASFGYSSRKSRRRARRVGDGGRMQEELFFASLINIYPTCSS
eukprot:6193475-Pleurochrysis_carterae.AAC.4